MKNVFAKLIILFLISGTVFGQGFRFGIQGSPGFNYVTSSDPAAQTSGLVRFNFGLIAEYNFAKQYALSTGINIAQRGGKMAFKSALPNDTLGTYKAGYVQIPLRLKMRTREFGYFTYFAEFGGSIDIKTNEKVTFDPEYPEVQRLDAYVSPVNLMFSIGLGTEYSFGGSTSATVGIYYNRSLFDNLNNKAPNLKKNYTYRFDYVALQLGFLF